MARRAHVAGKGGHPDFEALLARARNAGSVPHKQHLVPRSYLERWSVDGELRATDVNTGKSFRAAPSNVARERDFYNLDSPGIDPAQVPPLLFETVLGQAEGLAVQAIDALLVDKPENVDRELMAGFIWFLGFQMIRGRQYRDGVQSITNELFKAQVGEMTDADIRRILARQTGCGDDQVPDAEVAQSREFIEQLRAGDVRIRQQDAAITGMSGQHAYVVGASLLDREWSVWKTPPVLFTCDEPVVRIGGPGTARGEACGVADAAVIAFPLSPEAVLVMTKGWMPEGRLDAIEVTELNHEIMASATRWVFERGDRMATTKMKVPVLQTPADRTEKIRLGDPRQRLLRTYHATRWAACAQPPDWPVARWYQSSASKGRETPDWIERRSFGQLAMDEVRRGV